MISRESWAYRDSWQLGLEKFPPGSNSTVSKIISGKGEKEEPVATESGQNIEWYIKKSIDSRK